MKIAIDRQVINTVEGKVYRRIKILMWVILALALSWTLLYEAEGATLTTLVIALIHAFVVFALSFELIRQVYINFYRIRHKGSKNVVLADDKGLRLKFITLAVEGFIPYIKYSQIKSVNVKQEKGRCAIHIKYKKLSKEYELDIPVQGEKSKVTMFVSSIKKNINPDK